jgi:hypothetical protein
MSTRYKGNIFTKSKLIVEFPNGKNKILEIAKVEVLDQNRIDVHWAPYGKLNNTIYELSADRRKLFQVANTGGDMGPRRELHRC